MKLIVEEHTVLVKPEPENAFKNFLCKGRRLAFVLLIFSTLFIETKAHAQIVINELGIGAPSGDAAGGGEFTELFNKSGCTVNIGCYVLVYSGTSSILGASGWSVTIPAGTLLGPGQYYLIGGHGSDRLAQTSWTNGTPVSSTWINSYGTNGKNVADLDLGTATNTSGKKIKIGNLINTDGQVTLFKSDGSVASSISYNSGNNPGTYPVIPNSTGCSLSSITNPGNSPTNLINAGYSSYWTGLSLDANGNYQFSVNDPAPGFYATPGKPNNTNGISTQTVAASLPAANAGTSRSITAGTPTSIGAPPVVGNTYSWTSTPSGFSSTSANPTVSLVITTTYYLTETDAYGCSNTNSVVLSVAGCTTPPISGQANVCVGSTGNIYTTDLGMNNYTWTIIGGTITSGGTLTSNTATVTWNTSGPQSISVSYIDPVGACTTPIANYAVTVNTLPTITGTLSVCAGSTTNLTGSGTPAVLNPWTSSNTLVATVSSTGVVTGVAAGTSTITYTNNNGCQQTATVTVNPLPTITGTLNVCAGSTTNLTGSGTPAVLNPWTSSNTLVATVSSTGVVTGVAAGTSTITYTNNNGCQQTATVTVNPLPTITGTLNVCAGSTTPLTGSGTPAAVNPWTSSNTLIATVSSTGVVTGVAAGTSTITYTNNNGCQQTATVTVNPLPTITGTLNVCAGSTTNLTGSGTPAVLNPWTSSNTLVATVSSTGVVTGVAAGTSTITYTNNNSCPQTATVTVNPLPTITGTLNVCAGSTTNLTGSGTPAVLNPWTSSNTLVATVSSTGVVTGVAAGTSTISYTNNNGCQKTAPVTVNLLPTIFNVTGGGNFCTGGTGVLIGLSDSQVGVNYQLKLGGVNSGSPVPGTGSAISFGNQTAAGTYTVVATNATTGCTATMTGSVSVTTSTAPIISTNLPTSYSTCAGTVVSFTVGTTGGSPAPTVQWQISTNGGITWSNMAGETNTTLAFTPGANDDGNYYRAVFSNGCTVTTIPMQLIVGSPIGIKNPDGDPVSTTGCNGSPVTFSASANGKQQNMFVVWQISCGGAPFADFTSGTVSNTFTGSGSGVFTSNLTFTPTISQNGCLFRAKFSNGGCAEVYTLPATLTVLPIPTATVALGGGGTACAGNSVPVIFSGTPNAIVTYNINGGPSQTITLSGTGTATINLTSTSVVNLVSVQYPTSPSCPATVSGSVNITIYPLPAIVLSSPITICNGSGTTLTASGASTYSWSPATGLSANTGSSVTASPTSTTTYSVTGTDANGCTNSSSVTVTVRPIPTATISGTTTVCQGSPNPVITFTNPQTIPVIITYNAGAGNLTINVGASGTATISQSTTNAGTFTYNLVSVVYQTAPTCSNNITGSVIITINPATVIVTPPQPVIVCEGGTATFTIVATGLNLQYQWQVNTTGNNYVNIGGATSSTYTISPVTAANATNYQVIITGTCGTITSVPVALTVNPLPACNISGTNVICQGQTTSFTAIAGMSAYSWTGPGGFTATTQIINNISVAGVYTVTITNSNGCQSTCTRTLTVNPNPVVTVSPGIAICNGNSTTLTASGATTYSWSPSTGLSATTGATVTANPATTITYTVIGTTNGCTGTATVTVTVNPLPGAPTVTSNAICGPRVVNLSASGCAGGTLNWYTASSGGTLVNTGSTYSPNIISTTSYWVSCTDANGCISIRTQVTGTVNTVPTAPSGTGASRCGTGTVSLSASGCAGGTLKWYDAATGGTQVGTGSPFTTPGISATTSYWVSCTSAAGCEGPRTQVTATIVPFPNATISGSNSFCTGGNTILTANPTGATSYQWQLNGSNISPGQGGTSNPYTATQAGSYTVTVTSNGCTATSPAFVVTINPLPTAVISGTTTICSGSPATISVGLTGTAPWSVTYTNGTTPVTVNAIISSPYTFSVSPTTTTTYTLTAVNDANCTGTFSGSAIVTVNPIPSCSIAGNATVCSGNTATYTSTVTPGGGTVTHSWSITGSGTISGSTTGATVTVIANTVCAVSTFTLTDLAARNNCTTTCTYIVTVNPPPIAAFTSLPPNVTVACGSIPALSSLSYSNVSAGGSGTCLISGSVTSTQTAAPGSCGGTVTETWTFTDVCGRTITQNRIITVSPAALPTVTAPANITVACGAIPSPSTLTYTNGLSGGCLITGTSNPSTFSATPSACGGNVTETWTATDPCGRTIASVSRIITVSPATLPTMTAPANITVACGAIPAASTLTYTNGLSGGCLITGTSNPSTFSATPSACGGTVTEIWTATDPCGRTIASVSRTITVSPAALPTMTAPANITVACGAIPSPSTLTYTNGLGGGCLISGISNTSTFSATPSACGGTVTETWTTTDPCGRTITSVSRIITVSPAAIPTMTAPANITVACGAIPSPSTLTYTNGLTGGCLITGTSNPSTFSSTPSACGGTVTETWNATDACGRTITASRIITVTPAAAPTFTTPPIDVTVACGAIPVPSALNYSNGSSGTCLISGTTTSTQTAAPGPCGGTVTETWTATDLCGRTIASVSRTITVSPAALPTMTAPANITVACGAIPSPSTLTYSNGLSGGCLINGTSNPSTFSATPSACGGTVTETWTATDPCGRTIASVSRTITVSPAALPTMTAPANITVACGAIPSPSTLTYSNGLSGGCLITGTSNPSTFSATPSACGGTVTETWNATDACGRTITASRTIIVTPAAAPTFTSPPANITVACGAIPTVSSLNYSNGSSGTCLISGSATSTQTAAPGPCGGIVTETWNATDACGRTITASRTITVTPAAAPTFTSPPSNITVACGAIPAVSSLNYSNGLSGTCLISGSVTSTQTVAPGPCGGIVTETWNATDACGRTITASRTITVTPATAPTFTSPPANITIACGAIPAVSSLNYSNGSSGACLISGSATSTQTAAPGPCGGIVTETWNATDACGRTITASRTITVTPAAAPTFTSPPANITVACGAIPAVSSLNYSNALSGTCLISGTATSTQTAAPGPCGGIVTETWNATDACGRTITASRTIIVTPAAAPIFTSPPANITVACGAIPAVSSLNYSNGSSGTCLISELATSTQTAAPGPCGGIVTETWNATDACGRTITASRTITVTPAAAPTFTSPPANITVACGAIPAASSLNYSNGSSGACLISGSATSTQTAAPGPCGGIVTETWTATDACGRTITASRTIMVTSAAAPTFTSPPANITVACGAIPAVSSLNYSNGSSGACLISGSATSTQTAAPGPCGGIVTETWTATDACGRTITASRTITVTPCLRIPTFAPVAPICSGTVLNPLPTISNEGIIGSWSPVLNNTTTTTYTFTPTAGQCATTTTLIITVSPILSPVINCDVSSTSAVTFNWAAVSGATGYSISYQVNAGPSVNVGAIGNVLSYQVTGLTGGDNVSITVTPTGSGCFTAATTTCTATACTPPTANISYATPFCADLTTPQPVALTGTGAFTGGSYSASPAGLTISTTTGAITPSTSTSGTYTITYTVAASGGCPGVTATTSVTVAAVTTPTFNPVAAICSGATLAPLPTTSLNGINGSWSPALNNTTTTTYTFTPTAGQCATTTTLIITVNPNAAPTFNPVAAICSGTTLTPLPTTSLNSINGSWSPALNNTTTTTYTFTPTAGQCATTTTLTITINPNATPTFNPVAAICSGATLAPLPTTSLNGINGSWSPALNNTTTTTYTFTPTAGQCATTTTLTITVNLNATPTFNPVAAICSGATLAPLPTTSLNGINGVWSPALNNTTTTTYTFTPTAGQCATTTTLTITVNPNVSPTFNPVTAICSGATLAPLPTTSFNGITGSWSPVLNNTTTTTYTFTPTAGQCATTTTLIITVNPILSPVINCGVSSTSAVTFNWAAVSGATGYSVSYQINAGSSVNVGAIGNVLSYQVTGLTGGDNVSITVTPTGSGCFTAATTTCTATACTPPTANISYATPFCADLTTPQPVALTGTGAFTGGSYSASPAGLTISTTTGAITPSTSTPTTYTVTYIVAASGGCPGVTATTSVTVAAVTTPTFNPVAAICSGATLAPLPTTSLNGINGSWSPALNNTTTTTYTFTPTAGQCATTTTLTITVNLNATPTFNPVAAICSGATLAPLPTTSLNGINGVWSPALNNTTTTTYTFTPTAGQCATTTTLTITVNPNVSPTFNPVTAICSGATLAPLPTTSFNGITGSWSPVLNNTTTTTYTFTPTAGQCATTTTLIITVNPILSPVINCGVSSTSAVTFNWAAVSGATGYSVSYQINAGSSVNVGAIGNLLSYQVTGLTGGDNVSITVTPTGSGCFTAATTTCTATACTPPTANISYATPFCADLATPQPVALTGTGAFTGGSYSASPAGLTINATTGAITPSTSTPGTYTITYIVAASGGCPGVTATTSVTVAAVTTPTFNPVAAICSGATLAPLPTTSLNGINGSWSPALNNTTTTTYTFTPTAGQCATTTTLIITVNPILSAVINCGVSSTSAVTFNWAAVSVATGYSVSYQINAGTSVNVGAIGNVLSYQVTGLTGGDNVIITVTPTGSGCFTAATTTCTATACTPPTANISYATPFCADLATPQPVALTGTGAFTGGSYSASPAGLTINATTGAITPSTSTPGTYTITYIVAASGGCPGVTATTSVTVAAVTTPTFNPVAAICSGATLAPLPTTSLNGINGSWSPALNNTTTTTYTFTPTAGQCATTTTLIITVNPILSAVINCGVSSTSAVTFNWAAVSVATGYSVSYQINAGTSVNVGAIGNVLSYQVTGLTGGDNVIITVTPTGSGCFTAATTTCTATACTPPTANISYATPFCADLATPQPVALTGTGAFTGGSYSASPAGLTINATTGAITPSTSTPGTYTITYTVAASGGCPGVTATTSVTVAAVTTPTFNPVAAICSGATLAPLPTTSLNGINGSWSPALNNTTTTTYTFTPTAGQCATTTTLIITVNPILSAVINCGVSSTSAVTFNWAAVSVATGYSVSYQINAGPSVNVGAIGNVLSYQVTGLTGGDNVIITVTPTGSGCFTAATTTCTATACTPPTANISYATPFCADLATPQPVALTGTGAFTGGSYSASPAGLTINATTGAITPSTSTPGTYTITYTVAASGGCPGVTATTSVTVAAVTTPTFNPVAAICSGATLAPLPTTSLNGINGSWSPALNNTTTTTYTFTPTAGQCATTTTLIITVNPILSAVINCGVSSTSAVTFNWTAVSGATGYSVSYQINAGPSVNVGAIGNLLSYQVTGLTGGDNVIITVTPTGSGCFTAATTTCTATACTPPTANISYATPFCADLATPQPVALTGTGAFTGGSYSASPAGLTINATTGAITPSTSTPGTYTVTYTVATSGGCPGVTATTSVTINPIITPTFNTVAAVCSGATLIPLLTTSLNNITGTWSPALNNTTTTIYTFTPAAGQCAIPVTMTITVNSAVSSEFTAAACFLYNLPWGNIVTTSGDYNHTYQTINGCDSIVTAHITINNEPNVTTNAAVCVSQLPFVWNGNSYNAPGTYSLNLQNATGCNFIATLILKVNTITRSTTNTTICSSQLPFSWNGNTYTAAGSYSVTLQNVGSCDSIAELNLNINDTITSITRDSTCINQPYVWNGNSYTTSGTYTANLTNTAGCDSIATLILTVKPIPKIEVKDPPAVCEPLTVDLTAPLITAGSDPGLSYTYWMDSLATIPLANPNAVNVSGIYYIKAQDVNNCTSTKPVKITVSIYKLIAGLRYPTIITQKNKSTQLTARSIGNVYTWLPPIGLNSSFIKDPVFNYDRETEYRINITIGNGCITVDTVLVKIIPEIPPVVSDLFVPKAWTPNNDGHNDKLFPITVSIRELKYFRVYNRWGQLVFETNIVGEGWNGILQGKPAIMDVYTWTVEAIGVDGKHIKKTGNSVLIR